MSQKLGAYKFFSDCFNIESITLLNNVLRSTLCNLVMSYAWGLYAKLMVFSPYRWFLFAQNPEKGYRRLTPTQSVGLKYAAQVLTLKSIVKDESGRVTELKVTAESVDTASKPKAFIHWVAEPMEVEVRIYGRL